MYGLEGFHVRTATLDDISSLQEITKKAFEAYIEIVGIKNIKALDETREDIKKDIEGKIVYVAFMGDRIVGSVRLQIFDDKTAYLSRFGIDPKYQNSGYGKALMNIVDATMQELGIKELRLHTASKVSSLIRFYYGRGFYIDSTTKDQGYIRALLIKDYN